ncbi:MAG: acyltransferase, partial [Gammaproteobacteria bacterium]
MKYRSEIDGLRALAVLPVIFFHSKFSLFQGGFVGVDIFFVISGFLITKIILTEVFQSSFSLLNFYERRARRILPALFTVLIFTTMGAWLLLPPLDFKDYGQSLFFVSFFASNIFFWIESGYFGAGIDFKPLLHTWSLGVEEQFYIFFPVMVVLLFMINKKLLFPSILIIFLVSLIISQIYSGDQNHLSTREAAFFLLPSRAWELMIGSLLFFIKRDHNIFKKRKLDNFFSATGLILIIYSILFFSEETPFPSTYTLLPTLGAALIILFASQQTFAYKILSLRPMIFIGLISYSAYLWHQPILSLSRYYFVGELGVGYIFMSITFIFLFAYLSWRYIEKPFRDKSKVSRKSILTFSIIGLLFFSIIGFSIHFKDGYQSRFTEQENELL